MDFAKAFSFVFDDQDWVQKIIIGGLIGLIPIIGQLAVFGYMIAIIRNVIRGEAQPLPEWSDFGQMIIDGLYTLIIGLIYTLPIFIVMCLVMFPSMAIGGAFGEDGDMGAIGALGVCCFAFFSVIYGIAMAWFFLPAAMARYADSGDMMSALRFGEILAITRANPIVFLMALLVAMVANFVGGFGMILCCIGFLFTQFYSYCVIGHAYGQAYRAASDQAV